MAVTGDLIKLVHLRTPPPPVLTSGGHRSKYGFQAGGTHPTGMLSCFIVCFDMNNGQRNLNSSLVRLDPEGRLETDYFLIPHPKCIKLCCILDVM